ncbi:MAG: hypothetical protein JW727_05985, partial [Candidatus Aenigmarchaeota archaeon]|nr:hypothetical protein [Candidatus Aenigmarchaeota archaeon]
MPDHSAIWVPHYPSGKLADLVSGHDECSRGFGDLVTLRKQRMIFGGDYPSMADTKFEDSKSGVGILICPNCYEVNETGTDLKSYSAIMTGTGLKMDETNGNLILTC